MDAQDDQSKSFAYGLANQIKKELDSANAESNGETESDEDRQGKLAYDASEDEEPVLSTP